MHLHRRTSSSKSSALLQSTCHLRCNHHAEFAFFPRVDSALEVLWWMTDILSPITLVGASNQTPIMPGLHQIPCAVSSPALESAKSEQKTEFLFPDCFWECHAIHASSMKRRNPIWNLWLAPSPAWTASTHSCHNFWAQWLGRGWKQLSLHFAMEVALIPLLQVLCIGAWRHMSEN